jgi:diguanylate cyclase (GGDEF)-like protein
MGLPRISRKSREHDAGSACLNAARRLIPAIALLAVCCTAAWAADPPPITSLSAFRALSNAEASRALPVSFEATVTYYRDFDVDLFVQDGSAATYVSFRPGAKLLPGDRVLVQGRTHDSFRPIVTGENVTVLRHGDQPAPVPATAAQLFRSELDCQRVTVLGTIHSAEMVWSSGKRNIYLQALIDGGYIDVAVNSEDDSALRGLLDAEVEITGIATAKYDQKMQQSGSTLDVQSLADLQILKRAEVIPGSLPVTSMDDVLGSYHVRDLTGRVHVRGTVTYIQPGTAVVLQNGSHCLWILTMTGLPLKVGDWADASGFPDVRNGYVALNHGEVWDTGIAAPIAPLRVDWQELGSGGNAFALVSVEGQVVMEARQAAQDEYVLTSNGHLFSAVYRHPDRSTGLPLPAMKQVAIGSRVRVTGISTFYSSDPFNGPIASVLLIRSFADVVVVAGPSWLSIATLLWVVGVLLVVVLVATAWGWTTERKVRRQATALAGRIEAEAEQERRNTQLERLRTRILEEINGSLPLADIIVRITEMVTFGLGGAPCWCEVGDGARLGNYSPEFQGLRIIREEIPGRSGPLLGVLFAGLDANSLPGANETEALAVGARAVALAMETRRLNADLLHRSEFDLLTDINNRFSLEKGLNERMEEARQTAGIVGLIYIDLDDFKQVNDLYGHRIGDLYLQEIAVRMKRQLRSQDMLARLGGDEFAALIPAARSRARVEEIALRLEHCFDDPIAVEDYVLQGSASFGIALYPEDGATRESLLSAADAAMYVTKSCKKMA